MSSPPDRPVVDPPPLDAPTPPPLPPPPPPQSLPPDLAALLSRMPPPPAPPIGPLARAPSSAPTPPRQTREQTDEKCWVFTNQSNARRALGLEPQMSMYCYINFRNSLSSLTPVPGHPNAFLAKDAPQTSVGSSAASGSQSEDEGTGAERGPGELHKVVLKSTRVGEREVDLPAYWWRWLDGRYWYVAKGRKAVERHFDEMGDLSQLEKLEDDANDGVNSWKMITRIETRCRDEQEQSLLPGKREERQIKKSLGIIDLNQNSESLTSLSALYSTSLQRLHAHVLRIYSPLLTSLSLLPKTYTDGTQTELLSTIFTRLTDGSAFVLGERMVGALGRVSGELKERRDRRDEERRSRGGGPPNGFGGPPNPPVDIGLGGQQPRLPPPRSNNSIFGVPPLPPGKPIDDPQHPGGDESANGAGGGGGGSGEAPPADSGRERKPPRPVYHPGCAVM
ncbi:hypothetical protein JCM11491_002129 [Sporobolomyces phaffii]